MCLHTCIYIYIYIYREREREIPTHIERPPGCRHVRDADGGGRDGVNSYWTGLTFFSSAGCRTITVKINFYP